MTTNKIINGALIGATIGAIAGLLMTEKGKQFSGKIKEQGGVLLSSLWDVLSKDRSANAEKLGKNADEGTRAKKSAAT